MMQKILRNKTAPSEASTAKLKQILENKVPRRGRKTTHISRRDDKTKPNFGEPTLQVSFFFTL